LHDHPGRVNTARGPIINDDALYLALREGWIAGAGLDDIEEEPAKQRDWKPVNPLFGLDNVVITPHAAYYSDEAIRTVRDFAAHEVARGADRAAAALASERSPACDGSAPPLSVNRRATRDPHIHRVTRGHPGRNSKCRI
jgi:phosphoglycerate dehydrogenase-like enzyme